MNINLVIQSPSQELMNCKMDISSQIVIGRQKADVIVSDESCSRTHCAIFATKKGELYIQDLQSSNGTYLNGNRITSERIRVGDEIRVGDTRIQFAVLNDEDTLPNYKIPRPEYGDTFTGADTKEQHVIVHGSQALFTCLPKELRNKFSRLGFRD